MIKLNILNLGISIFIFATVRCNSEGAISADILPETSEIKSGNFKNLSKPKSEKTTRIDGDGEKENQFIHSYHFHTYFYHWDEESQEDALDLRDKIEEEIKKGSMKECRNNFVNFAPRGPHLIGNYETCCNATSMPAAISFFMQNRGNLSILFHPLTRWELADHTSRAMFLGPQVQMDTSALSVDLCQDVDNCSDDEMEYPDPNLLIV